MKIIKAILLAATMMVLTASCGGGDPAVPNPRGV